jgi:hypothetical protein
VVVVQSVGSSLVGRPAYWCGQLTGGARYPDFSLLIKPTRSDDHEKKGYATSSSENAVVSTGRLVRSEIFASL